MSPQTSPRPALPREIWVLAGAALLIALGYGLVAPVLPRFARSFDVSVAAASFVVSAFSLCRLLFAPAGGALIARLGERRIYLSGLLVVALSSVATALAQDYVQLLIFRGLGGIGSTMFTVSAMGLIVRLAPPTARGRASSLYATAFLFGNIGGPVIGGLLAELGLRVPFIVYAVALVLAAGVVWRLLPEHGTGAARRHRDGEGTPPMLFGEALRDSAFRAALVSGFANGWSNFGVRVALLPLFAAAVLDSGPCRPVPRWRSSPSGTPWRSTWRAGRPTSAGGARSSCSACWSTVCSPRCSGSRGASAWSSPCRRSPASVQ